MEGNGLLNRLEADRPDPGFHNAVALTPLSQHDGCAPTDCGFPRGRRGGLGTHLDIEVIGELKPCPISTAALGEAVITTRICRPPCTTA
jgi:hypothetical protein